MTNANPDDTPAAPTPSDNAPSSPSPPTLSYASADVATGEHDNLVTIARCASGQEAALRVNALESAGIRAITTNEHSVASLGLYSANLDVGVQVHKVDVEQAKKVLHTAMSDDVEPADEQPRSMPSLEPDGDPVPLAVVGRFDSIRALREAALLLESSRIRSVAPNLIPREGPAGQGDRFHLRVAEDDADRAEEILEDHEDEVDEDELRCPKCASWRIYPVSNIMPTIRWFLRLGDKPVTEMDCLECKHRGPKAEFEKGK